MPGFNEFFNVSCHGFFVNEVTTKLEMKAKKSSNSSELESPGLRQESLEVWAIAHTLQLGKDLRL